jgi:hypothetical protein
MIPQERRWTDEEFIAHLIINTLDKTWSGVSGGSLSLDGQIRAPQFAQVGIVGIHFIGPSYENGETEPRFVQARYRFNCPTTTEYLKFDSQLGEVVEERRRIYDIEVDRSESYWDGDKIKAPVIIENRARSLRVLIPHVARELSQARERISRIEKRVLEAYKTALEDEGMKERDHNPDSAESIDGFRGMIFSHLEHISCKLHLDPLHTYLLLIERLYDGNRKMIDSLAQALDN